MYPQSRYFLVSYISGRIVVATGLPEEKGKKTEVLDLLNPHFEIKILSNVPSRWGAVGGLIQEKPLIAGGYVFDHSVLR